MVRDPGNTKTGFPDRLAQKTETSWTKLAVDYAPFLCDLFQMFGVHQNDLEDEVQNALIAIPDQLGRNGAGIESFRGWLFVVVHNRAIQYHRRKTREKDKAAGGPETAAKMESVAVPVSEDDLQKLAMNPSTMEQLLDNVRPWMTDRDMQILLARLDGKTQREIAGDVGVSEATVCLDLKGRIARCLEREARKLIENLHV